MLSAQDGPDFSASESEQEHVLRQGPPGDFNPSPQIPNEPRSESEPEVGGLTVQDPPKGWPFSDMALQEKFQDQIQQQETAQRVMWASAPEQMKQQRYRQGRLLDGNSKGKKDQGSREETSGEQTYREYSKKKRIVKPSHSQGMRIRQSNKQYHSENSPQEETQSQPQQYHQEQFDQQKPQQEQFGPEPILQEDVAPRPKKTSKRRPSSSTNTGGPASVNVGYSLNFGSQEQGMNGRNPTGIVQNEVIHGEGAVSYSNAQLGNVHGVRNRPPNANTIEGRPIYVPPIPSNYNRIPQQNPPYNFPNQSPEPESLPNPSALIEQQINNYSPEGVSVVKSNSHFEIGQSPDSPQIITQLDHTQQYESVKPTRPPTLLHINDGTDFKWKNLGNGVEISAPVTPNGFKGGYRESIPIQEDNDEDIPIFEKKPPVFVPPVPPKPIVFNDGVSYEDPNAIFSGASDVLGNFPKGELLPTPQELTSNHIFEEAPPKLPSHPSGPPFSRRPNAYNHNFAEPPTKASEEIDLGFPKFPEMNKIYYLPNSKSGEAPIPAVAMPLSILRQITGALDSQSTAFLGQDISTADFMKMLSQNDVPEPPAQVHEPRPSKQRNHGFIPSKGPRDHEAHGSSRPSRGHHRYQQSYNKHSSNLNVGPYGLKITKSIPIYEQHTVSTQNDVSHGPWNSPPKHTTQHFNIPLEAYESLRPNSGNFKGRPSQVREENFPSGSGRQQYRHARQNRQQNRESAPSEYSHVIDGESFAVSSSYRIGSSASSGWNKHGRN